MQPEKHTTLLLQMADGTHRISKWAYFAGDAELQREVESYMLLRSTTLLRATVFIGNRPPRVMAGVCNEAGSKWA